MFLTILLSSFLSLPQEKKIDYKTPLLVYSASAAADLISTEIALRNPINREVNPLMGNRKIRIPLRLGIAAIQAGFDIKFQKQGKDTKRLRIFVSVLNSGMVVNNIMVSW